MITQLEAHAPAGLDLTVSLEELCVLWRAAGVSRPAGAPTDALEGLKDRAFAAVFQTALDGLAAKGLVDRRGDTEYQVADHVLAMVRRSGRNEGVLRLVWQLGDGTETRHFYGDRDGCVEHAAHPTGRHCLRAVSTGLLPERLLAYARIGDPIIAVVDAIELDRGELIRLAAAAARDGVAAARSALAHHGIDTAAAAMLADTLTAPATAMQVAVAFVASEGDAAAVGRRQLAVLDGGDAGCWLEDGGTDRARLRQVDRAALARAIAELLAGTTFGPPARES